MSSSFANRVQLEIKNRALGEVNELVLDNAEGKEIEGLSADLTALETLSLANVGLESLKGLPSLPSLKVLNLSSNSIKDLSSLGEHCSNLEKLVLSNNPITSESLSALAKMSHLKTVVIDGCELDTEAAKDALGDKIELVSGDKKAVNGAGDSSEKNGDSADAEAQDDDDDEDDEPGLEELEKEEIEDDNEDYNPEAEEEEDEEEEDDEDVEEEDGEDEEEDVARPLKRKADNGEEEEESAKRVHKNGESAAN